MKKMKQTCFSLEELGLERGEPTAAKNEIIELPQEFSTEINPYFREALIEALDSLSEELKGVFPVNIRRELEKMGVMEYKIRSRLEVGTTHIWRSEEREFNVEEFVDLYQTSRESSRLTIDDCHYWLIPKDRLKEQRENIQEQLKIWAEDRECVIDSREFLVIKDLTTKLEELTEYLRINSLHIDISVIREGIGDAVCNFSVFLSSEGEIKEIREFCYGSKNGEWEVLLSGKRYPERYLSFQKAIEKLEKRAKEVKATVKAIEEGFGLLFAET